MKSSKMALLLAAWFCLAGVSRGEDASAEVKMKLMPEGAMRKLGGYQPQMIKMSDTKPAVLKKAPELAAPIYGSIKFGGASHLIVLDEPEGKDAKLYVDANANGDLTDDPPATWEKKEYPAPGGGKSIQYFGSFKLPLGTDEKSPVVKLEAYRFDKNDPRRQQLKDTLLYYRDYALDGDITLAGKKYHAMLVDDKAAGDFTGKSAPVRLMIDRNGDGKFDFRSEMFDPAKPFNIGGTTWKLADLTIDGSFKIVKSDETVAEIQPPPDQSVGKKIMAFKATRMDGSAVNFPADYKGKLVMLDFWATWCGPCMGEVPGLVKAYDEYHPKGIDILGISLDQPDSAEKVKKVTGEKGMTWPQVYDGKFWEAEIAKLYGINSIPAAFLVDGDTGEILATGDTLRGESLEKTWKAALEKKGK